MPAENKYRVPPSPTIDQRRSAIRLALALTFFNFVGQTAARVVLTLYALEIGAPASAVGLIGGLLFVFPLLLSWPIGALSDRIGARGLLLFSAICGGASLLLPYFFSTLTVFYIAAAVNGLALACYHVTLQNVIGMMSPPENRARNFSNFSLTGAMTNFVGPLLAGFSIDRLGYGPACLVIASLSVIAVVLVLLWGRVLPPGNPDAPASPGGTRALLDREVVLMLLASGMVQLGTDLFQFYLPIYGHSIGLSASAIGTVLASVAVAAFVVRTTIPNLIKRFSAERLLVWVFFMGAIGFALVPLAHNAYTLGAIAFFFGLGMGIGIPLTVILMFSRSSEGRSGQTLGLRLTVNNFVRFTGPIVFGGVAAALGIGAVFWIGGAIMAASGLLSRANTPKRPPPATTS
jgi:MFS family permease